MEGIELAEPAREVGEVGPNWPGVSNVPLPLALRKTMDESPSVTVCCSASDPNGDIGDPGES